MFWVFRACKIRVRFQIWLQCASSIVSWRVGSSLWVLKSKWISIADLTSKQRWLEVLFFILLINHRFCCHMVVLKILLFLCEVAQTQRLQVEWLISRRPSINNRFKLVRTLLATLCLSRVCWLNLNSEGRSLAWLFRLCGLILSSSNARPLFGG